MTDLATLLEVGGPVAALGGGAAYTRAKHPGVYWSTVGLLISTARLLSSYSSVMEACGLTVAPSRLRVLAVKATTRREIRPVPPRRGIIRPTSTGLRLRLRLAPGQEPADVAASAERLRHAWGVHAVYVTTVKPGVVELRLVGFDVLRRVRMPRKVDGGFLKVPVALREDATPFVRDYRTVPHQLTLGATLSGKSMYLRHLVAGLAPQPVALVGIDCKRGVELAPFAARLSALATDPEQAAELLPVLVKEMEDRYDLIKARQGIAPDAPDEEITSDIWGLSEHERPVPIVLFVDEVAELFLVATRKDEDRRDEMVTQLIRLAQLGRAAGIYLEVCGQRFGAELGKGATMLRAQLTGRVCHRVNDEASAKMALGDIAPEAVSAACAIAPERPGLAVAGDTSGGWSRIRTPYLSLGDAAEICRQAAHLVPDLPALKRFRSDVPVRPVDTTRAPVLQPRPVTD
ncbi:conjugal transfer protein TraS [Streptomyces avermitilis]|uniref:Plasmid transfer protein n=2 Tax=Streptomyces avermitilis TaxID=33903 RepID=Q82H12_STRAW|nr:MULTISPECIES: FtsK/SpoIIIE domain-containing protein [Streptomyces]KUN56875.1 conjugal transfer protein TraS [Streptomyces avermitilis]MYS99331.1 conjugal transfer protein TraS [Streptomyces sp. SID5469]OOV32395.1 conjugal transfer protein TraS [Streptomyces avermitilis]BAC71446.1 putative plasmid transfer protein [Streptomyces avermitilis MA-4680 = NBRC 14893]BBJ51655.1 conjugal transfer protein TraS [Streptomyces avermitilis]